MSDQLMAAVVIRDTAKGHANTPPASRRKPAFLIRSTPILHKWYPKDNRDDLIALVSGSYFVIKTKFQRLC